MIKIQRRNSGRNQLTGVSIIYSSICFNYLYCFLDEIDKLTFVSIFRDLVNDYKFWRFVLFSFVIVGPKLVFSLLFFMLPKIIMQDYGEDAPFGIYISIAPILIIIFLIFV